MSAEVSLINAILTKKQIIPVIKKLTADHFLNPTSKKVYLFILDYFKGYKTTPSMPLVREQFSDFEVYQEENEVAFWIEKVIEKKCKADLTDALLEGSSLLQKEGGAKTLEFLQEKLLSVIREVKQSVDMDITKTTGARLDQYIDKATIKEGLIGVPCGLPKFDAVTAGFHPGELISIIGLPGIGKSFLATFFAANAWKAGYKVLFITLEMGTYQVAERFDSLCAGINHMHLKRGKLTQEELGKYKEYLEYLKPKKVPFIITKPSRCDQSVVLAKIQEHHPDICFIDYSRLMLDERKGKDYKAIGNIVQDLKQMAGDEKVNIPIVLLSQVNRGFDRSKEILPDIHDIAECFMVATDSDLVIACHATGAMKEDNEMLVGIQKHRDGRNIRARLHWDLDKGRIEEADHD